MLRSTAFRVAFGSYVAVQANIAYSDAKTRHPYSQPMMQLYSLLPWKGASRLWGFLTDQTIPENSRAFVYGTYARAFGCNMDEALDPNFKSYRSLGDFFFRRIKENARRVEGAYITSPADGKVLTTGKFDGKEGVSVKGVLYSQLSQLFAAPINSLGLNYCIIYLAPGDYHRFHAPVDKMRIESRIHVPGSLLSVNPAIVERMPTVFTDNERVSLLCKENEGKFVGMCAVGACNVGSIVLNFDDDLKTNRIIKQWPDEKRVNGLVFDKGQELGGFRLGSSIVLVFEGEGEFKVMPGDSVLVGQSLFGA